MCLDKYMVNNICSVGYTFVCSLRQEVKCVLKFCGTNSCMCTKQLNEKMNTFGLTVECFPWNFPRLFCLFFNYPLSSYWKMGTSTVDFPRCSPCWPQCREPRSWGKKNSALVKAGKCGTTPNTRQVDDQQSRWKTSSCMPEHSTEGVSQCCPPLNTCLVIGHHKPWHKGKQFFANGKRKD